ncbi:helix-turn-helix domain-containing protein [Hydrocarboniclastica marina]|uniref:XRE family transcriptional regulator n=1 Tax=Hydrocarboniclastica marina TaxID=2259620 RepID=A0A4P7XF70_9ALTE|nr:helix-turn-helix domain-containing protein [Hydrocarboniclastica marina]QCF25546.1 XRE family transcriptional regulator [Hydrocarboniclastica marina]
MATDDEKSQALEELLKDSLHTLDSMEKIDRLQSRPDSADEAAGENDPELPDDVTLLERLGDLTGFAFRLARRTTGTSLKVGRALMGSQDQLKAMLAAGRGLRDLREVAGLTVNEMAEALDLRDKSVLEAAENGTATLSFELILRLAALLARNDPVPFILKYTRTYNPDLWRVMDGWGLGRLPLHFEREREFINIYRRHDEARKLSDEGFAHVLQFTRSAFEMSLHFVAEQEAITSAPKDEADGDAGTKKTTANRSSKARGKKGTGG